GEATALVHTAAAEVGQGLVTVQAQIARTELGVQKVVIAPADDRVGDAGSSSASRQSYMTGGAVKAACEPVRARLPALGARRLGRDDLAVAGGKIVSREGGRLGAVEDRKSTRLDTSHVKSS